MACQAARERRVKETDQLLWRGISHLALPLLLSILTTPLPFLEAADIGSTVLFIPGLRTCSTHVRIPKLDTNLLSFREGCSEEAGAAKAPVCHDLSRAGAPNSGCLPVVSARRRTASPASSLSAAVMPWVPGVHERAQARQEPVSHAYV